MIFRTKKQQEQVKAQADAKAKAQADQKASACCQDGKVKYKDHRSMEGWKVCPTCHGAK